METNTRGQAKRPDSTNGPPPTNHHIAEGFRDQVLKALDAYLGGINA